MKKMLGYALSIIGVLGLILTIEKVREIAKINFLASVTSLQITIISVVIIAIGLFLVLSNKGTTASPEVPIYHGDKIVGYRRH